MTTTSPARAIDALNRSNPSTLADLFALLKLGDVLRAQIPQVLRRKVPAADAASLGTLNVIRLPEDAKAATILRATVLAVGSGSVLGELTPQAFGATPSTGQCAVTPSGDIGLLASDAATIVDVTYLPERGKAVTSVALPVTSNVLTLPSLYTQAAVAPTPSTGGKGVAGGVVLLHDVEATVGTATGRKVVLAPGSSAPSAGQARLNAAKTTVTFASADAVTEAVVSLLICQAEDLDAILRGQFDSP